MSQDILSRLRTATASAHTSLENTVEIPRRLQDLASYRDLLEKFWGWYHPLEAKLLQVPGWPFAGYDPHQRIKATWLEQDLLALGLSASDIQLLPQCQNLPAITTLPEAMGLAYVMEGATLGGRQISGLMQESRIPPAAQTFFHSYGTETGTRWKEFLAALSTLDSQPAEHELTLTTATAAFASLEAWLTQPSTQLR